MNPVNLNNESDIAPLPLFEGPVATNQTELPPADSDGVC